MKKHITTIVSALRDYVPYFLSCIALFAIVWFVCLEFELDNSWWYLLLVSGVTGLSFLIPVVSNRFKPLWSIVGIGLSKLIPIIDRFAILIIPMIITELLAYGRKVLHFGGILIDVLIAIFASWLLVTFSTPIATIIILPVAIILSLVIDFDFNFSLKKDRVEEDTTNSKE